MTGNPADFDFDTLRVYGLDFNLGLFKGIALEGAVTESNWSGNGQQDIFGISDNDRRAYDLRLRVPLGRAQLTGFYKRLGHGFDAPGSWGRIGNWINPRGIEGFGGMLEMPLGRRLVLDIEGAGYNYRAQNRAAAGGVPGSNLYHIRAGVRYPLTSRNNVDFGGELVGYSPEAAGGVKRIERYINAGYTHQFNPNMSMRLLYQFLSVDSSGFFESPGFDYKANIIATQFQVRF